MELWKAIGLGVLQGLAEFLPVSSSGHLTLFQMLFGLEDIPMTLDILLHIGTLAAVFAVYWKRIWNMILHPFKSELKWLVLATIPAVVAALTVSDVIEAAFEGQYLGACFLLTSFVLLAGEALGSFRKERHKHVKWYDALAMGVMQAFAILPGLSRSGSTLAGGLATGLKRKKAADFAFLMSIPAILGSLVLDVKDMFDAAQELGVPFMTHLGDVFAQMGGVGMVLLSMAVAAVVGFVAIKCMVRIVRKGHLKWFAVYTCLLGLAVIAWQLVQGGML